MTSDPVEITHRRQQAVFKTIVGLCEWNIGMASGGYSQYFVGVLTVHTKAACLSQMGFDMQGVFAVDDIDAKEDMIVAETLLCLERSMFTTELRNMRYYSDRPPMCTEMKHSVPTP